MPFEFRPTETQTVGGETHDLAGILVLKFIGTMYRAKCLDHRRPWLGPRRRHERDAGRDLTEHRRGHR